MKREQKWVMDADAIQRIVAGALRDVYNRYGGVKKEHIGMVSTLVAGSICGTVQQQIAAVCASDAYNFENVRLQEIIKQKEETIIRQSKSLKDLVSKCRAAGIIV